MGNTMETEAGCGWKRVFEYKIIPSYRSGWLGVWDELKATITRKPRLTIAKKFNFSCFVKTEAPVQFHLVQMEDAHGDDFAS